MRFSLEAQFFPCFIYGLLLLLLLYAAAKYQFGTQIYIDCTVVCAADKHREFPWKVDGLNYGNDVFLFYFGVRQPKRKHYRLLECCVYEALYFDAWNMTVENIGKYSGECDVILPGRPYCGLILKKTEQ